MLSMTGIIKAELKRTGKVKSVSAAGTVYVIRQAVTSDMLEIYRNEKLMDLKSLTETALWAKRIGLEVIA